MYSMILVSGLTVTDLRVASKGTSQTWNTVTKTCVSLCTLVPTWSYHHDRVRRRVRYVLSATSNLPAEELEVPSQPFKFKLFTSEFRLLIGFEHFRFSWANSMAFKLIRNPVVTFWSYDWAGHGHGRKCIWVSLRGAGHYRKGSST